MKTFKVLGGGCRNCEVTARLIEEAAREARMEIVLEKVTDMAEILGFGVMSTPGLVLDGQVVHAGGIPVPDQARAWMQG